MTQKWAFPRKYCAEVLKPPDKCKEWGGDGTCVLRDNETIVAGMIATGKNVSQFSRIYCKTEREIGASRHFPVTAGFLSHMRKMAKIPLPSNISAGHRTVRVPSSCTAIGYGFI